MFPSGTASPPRSAAAAPAGGWREEGRSLARRPLARRGSRQLLGAVAGEPARGTGLILPLSALLVQIEKKNYYSFVNPPSKEIKSPSRSPGCGRTQTPAACAAPLGLRLQHFPLQKCEAGRHVCGRGPRVRPPSPDSAGFPIGPAVAGTSAAPEREWLARELGSSSPASGGQGW